MDKRQEMVRKIREEYRLDSPNVLSVMLKVPREKFVSKKYRNIAYEDGPVPIGYGQTMSQPYTVCYMTDLLELTGEEIVLEVGTGSGYQAAILSKLAKRVYTIEIVPELARQAKKTLKRLGYKNIYVSKGSGEWGWPGKLKFDAIIITAAIEEKVPEALFEQLKIGGVLVVPVGRGNDKTMMKYKKVKGGKLNEETHGIFHFVPFVEEKDDLAG